MTDRDDIDMLAAEYVLGTLDKAERASVSARRLRDPMLNRAIADWNRRMVPLLEHAEAVPPSPDLFAKIEAQIAKQTASVKVPQHLSDVASIRRRLARWRAAAIGASAIAAALAAFILMTPPAASIHDQKFVAVFQRGDQLPSFLLAIDLKTRQLTVRPVDASSQPGKTYQLWIVSEKLGPAPRSLGLLESISQPTQKRLPDIDPAVLETATFGISLEPEGGSPTGRPTGPALHGKLYPTSL